VTLSKSKSYYIMLSQNMDLINRIQAVLGSDKPIQDQILLLLEDTGRTTTANRKLYRRGLKNEESFHS
jgi:hypothetical protein